MCSQRRLRILSAPSRFFFFFSFLNQPFSSSFFFFNDTATTEIYTLSLHDALPISPAWKRPNKCAGRSSLVWQRNSAVTRSEEHTSELQSQSNLVCRLLLEKKKKKKKK